MSTSVGEVVAHLLAARDGLAVAAVTASRARADADQASAHYREAARGSDHAKIRSVIAAVGVAGAKSDRVARLISEIREHITAYVNHIAPGAAPTDNNAPDALPDGERLATEASDRQSRLARAHRRITEWVADNEGDLKDVERISHDAISAFKDLHRPSGGTQAGVSTPKEVLSDGMTAQQSQHPLVDLALAVAGLGLATRASYRGVKKIRERKSGRGDQAGDS